MEQKPHDITGRDAQREAAKASTSLSAAKAASDVQWLMADERGRRIVYRLLSRTGVFRSTFVTSDGLQFAEGRRSVGAELLAIINDACPHEYGKMISENRHD